jgi:hypothetical protein
MAVLVFVNHYRCPNDGVEWSMTWSCMCNDRCPRCDAEIEPYQSEDAEPICLQPSEPSYCPPAKGSSMVECDCGALITYADWKNYHGPNPGHDLWARLRGNQTAT